jgi:hypothetical protein
MKKFKGMTYEQCVKYVKKMNKNEMLEFFTIKIKKFNPLSDKCLPYIGRSLPDLILVHPWWMKIEMMNYGKSFYEYFN